MKIGFAIVASGVLALCISCGGSKPKIEDKAQASAVVKTENYDEAINAAKGDPHNSVVPLVNYSCDSHIV